MINTVKMKDVINDKGIKQKILAKKVGTSERTMSLILNGKATCPLEVYINICKELNVAYDTFIIEHKSTA